MITSGPWHALRPADGQDVLRRRAAARHRRQPPDRLRPRPVGAVRPQGRQPRPLVVRAHQVADVGRAGRQVERRVRQPAAAPVGGDVARVPRAGRGAARPRRHGRQHGQLQARSADRHGLRQALRGHRLRDLRGAAGPGRAGRRAEAGRSRPRRRPSEGDDGEHDGRTRRRGAREQAPALAAGARTPGDGRRGRAAARSGVAPGCRAGAFVAPAMLVVLGLSIFPAVWAFWLSLQSWDGFSTPTCVGLGNYQQMVTDAGSARRGRAHDPLHRAVRAGVGAARARRWRCCSTARSGFIGFYRTAIFVPFVASAAATGILTTYLFNPQFGLAEQRCCARCTCRSRAGSRTRRRRWSSSRSCRCGARPPSPPSSTWPPCRTSRASCSRRPASTAPTGGSRSGTSTCPQLAPGHRVRRPSGRSSGRSSCSTSSTRRPAAARSTRPRRSSTTCGRRRSRASSSGTARRSPTACSR